jgi:hypothetical protein
VRRRNQDHNPANTKPIKDLTGQRFGLLKVLTYESRSGNKSVWICICECGNQKGVRAQFLLKGLTNSCGCLRKTEPAPRRTRGMRHAPPAPLTNPRSIDLAGQSFGLLTAVHYTGKQRWFCACGCGGSTVATTNNLRRGIATSCGCKLKAILRARNTLRCPSVYRRPAVMKAGLRLNSVMRTLLLQAWNNACAYCERCRPLTIDHVRAISRGGAHELGNLVPACRECNLKKLNHPLEKALPRLGSKNFQKRRIAATILLQELLHAHA